jgi:MFS family permease
MFLAGLIALLLGLNRGHDWGWTSPPIIGILLGSTAILVFFLRHELRVPYPMLDLSLFKHRLFSISTGSAVINYIALYSIMFLLPFYLIEGRGLNSAQAGLLLTVQPIVMAIVAPFSGTLSDRIGARLLTFSGMGILTVGLLVLSRLGSDSPETLVMAGLAIAGLGNGIFISPNNSTLMGSAPRHRQGIAAGILATARNVGMVLGVGIAGAIFSTVQAQGMSAGVSNAMFSAFSISFLASAGIATLGTLLSLVRGTFTQAAVSG